MTRILTITAICACLLSMFSTNTTAQEYAVKPWNIMVSPSLSIGHVGSYYRPYNYGGSYNPAYGVSPNFMISGKLVFHEFVSAGPFFGISVNRYDSYYSGLGNNRAVTTAFGAKGSFHYWNMLDKLISDVDFRSDEFDLYANLYIGSRLESVRYYNRNRQEVNDTDVNVIFHPNLGARWFAADFFGLFVELGWSGMGYFKAGCTFKFN